MVGGGGVKIPESVASFDQVFEQNLANKMKIFAWSNDDVVSWLQQASVRAMTQKEVASKILLEYGRKINQTTISRQIPKEREPEALEIM